MCGGWIALILHTCCTYAVLTRVPFGMDVVGSRTCGYRTLKGGKELEPQNSPILTSSTFVKKRFSICQGITTKQKPDISFSHCASNPVQVIPTVGSPK